METSSTFFFRPEQNEAEVSRGLGEIGFSLTRAQAYFKEGDLVTPVAVSGGELLMDFNKNARLLWISTICNWVVPTSKRMEESSEEAIFHSRNDESRIVGAVSLDGLGIRVLFRFL